MRHLTYLFIFLLGFTVTSICQSHNAESFKPTFKTLDINGVFIWNYKYCVYKEMYWFDSSFLVSNGEKYNIVTIDPLLFVKDCENKRLNRKIKKELKKREYRYIIYDEKFSNLSSRVNEPNFKLDENRHYGGDLYSNMAIDSMISIAFSIEGRALLLEEYCNNRYEMIGFAGCPCPRMKANKPFLSLLNYHSVESLTNEQIETLNLAPSDIDSFSIMECD